MNLFSLNNTQYLFPKIVIFFKFTVTLILTILAFLNNEIHYILKKPTYLLQDALVLSIFTCIAAIIVEWSRIGTFKWLHITQLFLFFFTFSILREFAGYFNLVENKDLTEKQKKQKWPLIITLLIIFVPLFFLSLYVAYNEKLYPKNYMFFNLRSQKNDSAWTWFLLFETFFFVLFTASAEIIICMRHFDYKTLKSKLFLIFQNIGLFTSFHIFSQLAGFYSFLDHYHSEF